MTKRQGDKEFEYLTERYAKVQKALWGDNPDEEAKKNYRERLLGPDLIAGVPAAYTEIDFQKKFPGIWDEMELWERAKFKAHAYLENMKELTVEHMRLRKQLLEEKEREVKAKSANKGKTRKT